jgi:hypothetical protein
MTDDELIDFVNRHRHWSPKRLEAFVNANMEFDVAAEQRRKAKALVDEMVESGQWVRDGHGSIERVDKCASDFADPHPERQN